MSEVIAALVGAVVGVALGSGATYWLTGRDRARQAARLVLVEATTISMILVYDGRPDKRQDHAEITNHSKSILRHVKLTLTSDDQTTETRSWDPLLPDRSESMTVKHWSKGEFPTAVANFTLDGTRWRMDHTGKLKRLRAGPIKRLRRRRRHGTTTST